MPIVRPAGNGRELVMARLGLASFCSETLFLVEIAGVFRRPVRGVKVDCRVSGGKCWPLRGRDRASRRRINGWREWD